MSLKRLVAIPLAFSALAIAAVPALSYADEVSNTFLVPASDISADGTFAFPLSTLADFLNKNIARYSLDGAEWSAATPFDATASVPLTVGAENTVTCYSITDKIEVVETKNLAAGSALVYVPDSWKTAEGKAVTRSRTNLVKFVKDGDSILGDAEHFVDISEVEGAQIIDASSFGFQSFAVTSTTNGGGGGSAYKAIGSDSEAQDYLLVKFKLADLCPEDYADNTGTFTTADGKPASILLRDGSTLPYGLSQDYEESDDDYDAPVSDAATAEGTFVSYLSSVPVIVSGNAISIVAPDADGYVTAYVNASTMEMGIKTRIERQTRTLENDEWEWSTGSTGYNVDATCVEADVLTVTLDVEQGTPAEEAPQDVAPAADNPTVNPAPTQASEKLSKTADTATPYAWGIIALGGIAIVALARKMY